MEVVLFRNRARGGLDEAAYGEAFSEMLKLATQAPGFVSIEGFTGEDGSELAVVLFESPETLAQWRSQPDHLRVQERGRGEFFDSYDITVATVSRRYSWDLEAPTTKDVQGD